VLGDVALGRIDYTLSLIGKLSGHKLLVAGNHDRCWAGHGRRSEGWSDRYLEAGFDEVHHGEVAVDVGDTSVRACHFPYRGDSQEQDRYLEHRPIDNGAWLLHGHVHERWLQHERMINVGVDVWGYQPVNYETIDARIAAGPMTVAGP
jgi:calcineurin-like phosphoesterase family protein